MQYSIFSVFGVELEYMIVNRDTLQVMPIADKLLNKVAGSPVSDYDNGLVSWSNELVNHVIELKTTEPTPNLSGFSQAFHDNVVEINKLLLEWNAMLLPTGAHPLMNPYTEMVLWPHEHSQIYKLYNRIFDCRGHGWANLQSTHINLPFSNTQEFAQLHAAIRLLLPIIPALTASTPILDGKITGLSDSRLETYRHNQKKIPVISGMVIPEAVYSEEAYTQEIFNPIKEAITPYDQDKILDTLFLNSRGAIARFDRGAIEIRIIDIQEAPKADIALVNFITLILKKIVSEKWSAWDDHSKIGTSDLAQIFQEVIKTGQATIIQHTNYLQQFGIEHAHSAKDVWLKLFHEVEEEMLVSDYKVIQHILKYGNLSKRIMDELPQDPTEKDINRVYQALAQCLANNQLYE